MVVHCKICHTGKDLQFFACAKFHPDRSILSPVKGEKPEILLLETKLNVGAHYTNLPGSNDI